VPAYNEERNIKRAVESLSRYFRNRAEIIVVAQGNDRTAEVARKTRARSLRVLDYKRKLGKGKAVRIGLKAAKGRYVAIADADLSSPPKEIDKLFSYLNDYDVAIGSRALPESILPIKPTIKRKILGYSFNFIVNALFGLGIRDTQCGFKVFRRSAVKSILPDMTIDGWEFDVEMLYEAKRRKLKIAEVPVLWTAAPTSKVVFSDSFRMLKGILALRMKKI
jgi:glycosyltransferase involved in cell wall biosynthesis